MAYYRPAKVVDCEELAPKMREADVREVYAASGLNAFDALITSMAGSDETNSIIHNDEVIGMFGVGACEISGNGVPWLLGSDEITNISLQFLRESRVWIKDVQTRYPILYNHVAAENEVAVAWLRFLGFKFIRRMDDYMGGGLTFYEFVRIKDV